MPAASLPSCRRDAQGGHAGYPLLRQVLNAYHASRRPSCSAQRSRGCVRHSTRKPWRQKGLGRARAGMTSSPLWRGGGRAFPSMPSASRLRRVNKRMLRLSLRSQVTQAASHGRLALVEALRRTPCRTRELRGATVGANGPRRTMVVVGRNEVCRRAYMAARNVSRLCIVAQRGMTARAIHLSGRIVMTRMAAADIATAHSLCDTQSS
ncbi:50S ribosomal protein L4 [Candidatus Tremblaya princeps]|uniref:Large ribosomal subunit protein uL4 n=1 Tax=Tremblaya princeps TaxID=189385 RepID=A0A143WNS4_TREPR|nr:50S ribosomal protein L4 [Candidatus Tremblaya princeps]